MTARADDCDALQTDHHLHHHASGHHTKGALSFPAGLTPRQLSLFVRENDLHLHAGRHDISKHHGDSTLSERALRAAESGHFEEWKRREWAGHGYYDRGYAKKDTYVAPHHHDHHAWGAIHEHHPDPFPSREAKSRVHDDV